MEINKNTFVLKGGITFESSYEADAFCNSHALRSLRLIGIDVGSATISSGRNVALYGIFNGDEKQFQIFIDNSLKNIRFGDIYLESITNNNFVRYRKLNKWTKETGVIERSLKTA